MKEKLHILADVVTAFVVSGLIFATVALLSDFNGTSNISLDVKNLTFTFFGNEYILDDNVPKAAKELLEFNGKVLGIRK